MVTDNTKAGREEQQDRLDEEFGAYLDTLYDRFAELRRQRHLTGQTEYGEFTFLENDMIRMMLEELADAMNYMEMHAVKLMMLHEQMEQTTFAEHPTGVEIVFQSFKGTKDVGWDTPDAGTSLPHLKDRPGSAASY